jgi:prepilin-type processing-associated H-X9-DG protein
MKTIVHPTPNPNRAAFSRVDLLMVLATFAVLSVLEVVAVSSGGAASQSARCLDNLRAMTRAWQQFDMDHHYLPPNPDDGNTIQGFNWVPGQAGRGGGQEFNPDILTNATLSLLFPYLTDKTAVIFRCPDDLRVGLYQGNDPQKRGTKIPCARSYSMNVAVGSNPYVKMGTGVPTDGAWLDGAHAHQRYKTWRTYGKLDDIVDPAPSGLAVLLDEDADSINDGVFAFGMVSERWIDWPGTRHEGGGTLSYADGHAELRHWVDPRTAVIDHKFGTGLVPGSLDYQWLRSRISASRTLPHPLVVPRTEGVATPDVKLVWTAQQGASYRIETSEDLNNWKPFDGTVQIANGEASIADTGSRASAGKYYRIIPVIQQ